LPVIAVVVPCYNEEQALPLSVPRLLEILDEMAARGIASDKSYILLCNDGSRDRTWQVIEKLHADDRRVRAFRWPITADTSMCCWRD